MYYNVANKQWILDRSAEQETLVGMVMAEKVLREGIGKVSSGQVLILTGYNLAFQTIEDIALQKMKSNTLVGYEPGSLLMLDARKPPKIVPAILFRKCRFPTNEELRIYEENNCL